MAKWFFHDYVLNSKSVNVHCRTDFNFRDIFFTNGSSFIFSSFNQNEQGKIFIFLDHNFQNVACLISKKNIFKFSNKKYSMVCENSMHVNQQHSHGIISLIHMHFMDINPGHYENVPVKFTHYNIRKSIKTRDGKSLQNSTGKTSSLKISTQNMCKKNSKLCKTRAKI